MKLKLLLPLLLSGAISVYGDMGISIQMGGKPVLSIGWDEEIHGIRSNSFKTLYIIPFSRNLRQRNNLLNGNTEMSRIIKCF